MEGEPVGTIAVCGATGRQGRAVTRHLLSRGFAVRSLTRKPEGRPARALAAQGASVVAADMDDERSLIRAFEGADGVYSVQNGLVSGFGAEVAQGRNVVRAAQAAGVRHVVYGSAGTGDGPSGVPSWDAKLQVERELHAADAAWTVLRPTAFMELMTDKGFYPAVGTWRLFPRITGEDVPIPWLAVDDLGVAAAAAFADPAGFAGRDLRLAADVRTLAQCRSAWVDVTGRPPRTFPMPVRLFDRFTRGDVTAMWRHLRTADLTVDLDVTRALVPSPTTIRSFIERSRT